MRRTRILRSLLIGTVSAVAIAGAAAGQTRDVSIPAESLKLALDDYIKQFGTQLVYNADDVSGLQSHAVSGLLDADQALNQLLEGTGIVSKHDSSGAIVVSKQLGQRSADSSPMFEHTIEQVVVTGTSIRGVAPIGTALYVLDASQIEQTGNQTVDQILKDIPEISNSSSTPQGNQPGNSNFSPTVHDLGSSSSNSTLVLIDGHRMANDGQQQPLYDPGIIPPIILQRIEVLTDGASSVYGSDAVAGVVNFITRTSFDGFRLSAQVGSGKGYSTYGASLLWGTSWGNGSIIFGANLSDLGGIENNFQERPYTYPNHIPQGGTNSLSLNCDPASIQPNGSGNIYLSAMATTSFANNNANLPCSTTHNFLVSPEKRANGMTKLVYQVDDRLTMNVDVVYSDRLLVQTVPSTGSITVTAFSTGPQANPFYINPPGVTATKQTVRYDFYDLAAANDLNSVSHNDAVGAYIDIHPEYKLTDDLRLTTSIIYAIDNNLSGTYGGLCSSCASEALNGTTNIGGSTTTPSIVNTSIVATTLPLTTANALDVWNPLLNNRTSAAELRMLNNSDSVSRWFYTTQDYKIGVDGKAFDLPGGPVSIAIGGEAARYAINIEKTSTDNTGPASTSEQFLGLNLQRTVTAAFGEVLIPVIGPDMGIPFVQKIDVDLSGRYDHYSDVGATSNPKVGLDWVVIDGLKFRASWATSFVAPELSSVGDRTKTGPGGVGGGFTTFTGYSTASSSFSVPQTFFPNAALVPGVTCTAGTCAINGGAVQGISFNGGPDNPMPSHGKSWSIGVDVSPTLITGLSASVSLFNTAYINGITGASLSNGINVPSLGLLTFCPATCSQAQIQAIAGPYAVVNSYPTAIYYIDSVQQNNILNLDVEGLDMSANYSYDTNTLGTFSTGASFTQFLLFNQHVKGGPTFSVLGTTGFNNTFPSIAGEGTFNIGWNFDDFSARVVARYVSSYRNWGSGTVIPVDLNASGFPASGGDKVNSNTTFDMHLSYSMEKGGFMGIGLDGSSVFFDVSNVFDKAPVFYNAGSGTDSYAGNVIGRVITIGIRANL